MVSALLATSLQCTKLCQLLTYTRNKCPNWELVIYNLVNNHSLWKANHWGKITSNTMKFNKLKLCCFICVNKSVAIWQWTWVAIAKFNMAFVWKCGGKWQGTDNEKYRHETFCNWMDIVQRNCNCLASKFTLHQGQFHSFLVTHFIFFKIVSDANCCSRESQPFYLFHLIYYISETQGEHLDGYMVVVIHFWAAQWADINLFLKLDGRIAKNNSPSIMILQAIQLLFLEQNKIQKVSKLVVYYYTVCGTLRDMCDLISSGHVSRHLLWWQQLSKFITQRVHF